MQAGLPARRYTGWMSNPLPPHALPIRQVLDQSAPLVRLVQRLRESQQRFEIAQAAMPALLRKSVKPGPVDDTGWTLLAANAAVAAKLRHLVPAIEARLSDAGWPVRAVRVKVEAVPGG